MDYLLVNIAVAMGIAADAMLATIASAQRFRSLGEALKWAGAIGLTHWLFPMVGFIGGWYLVRLGVGSMFVFGFGAIILGVYIVKVLNERSAKPSTRGPTQEGQSSFWLAVWAVSVDALVTGPGKTAATAHWNARELWLSFPLVGAIVFVMVLGSTLPALALNRRLAGGKEANIGRLTVFFVVSTWTELMVFVWFFFLSISEAVMSISSTNLGYWHVTLASLVLCSCLALVFGRRILLAQAKVAQAVGAG